MNARLKRERKVSYNYFVALLLWEGHCINSLGPKDASNYHQNITDAHHQLKKKRMLAKKKSSVIYKQKTAEFPPAALVLLTVRKLILSLNTKEATAF